MRRVNYHEHGCDGRHDRNELACTERMDIIDGNRHNPWKCFSPDNVAGFHRFTIPTHDAICDYRGCPRLRSEMAAYWGMV